MLASNSLLARGLRFLGRVQFTTLLLVAGVVIMTAGTLVESRQGREFAWFAVYGTLWFDVFLLLIGVNLVVAVVNRIPIRRHQWPFVVTHFAIVLLLAGAWISRSFGYEGRLVIYEGSTESQLVLDTSQVRARWVGPGAAQPGPEQVYPLPAYRRLDGRVLAAEGQGRPGLRIAEYVPQGVSSVEPREGVSGGVPGVVLTLSSGAERVERWLLADHPEYGQRDLGPAEIELRRVGADAARAGRERQAVVLLTPGGGLPLLRIPVPAALPSERPLGDGRVAVVQRYLARARMQDGKLVEAGQGGPNPAAVVELRAGARSEVHTVFARFPEFRAVQRAEGEPPMVERVRLDVPGFTGKPRVALLLQPDGGLFLQQSTADARTLPVPLREGQPVSLTALGFDLRLDRRLESAVPRTAVTPAPAGSDDGRAWLRVAATLGRQERSLWLDRGSAGVLALAGGHRVEVGFGPQTRPLPFAIALRDFELLTHPGSNRPSEYRSTVDVAPAASDLPRRDAVISMNRPLDVAGFRLFQSSYQLGEGGRPDATVLSVSYDPGASTVYVSLALLIVGIAWGLRGVRPRFEHAPVLEPSAQEAPAAARFEARGAPARAGLGALLLAALLAGSGLPGAAEAAAGDVPVAETRQWAILADGRVKPLLTFANETALAVTGRERSDGLDSLELLWGYVFASPDFRARPYVRVDSPEVKRALGLEPTHKRFSFDALFASRELQELVNQAMERQQRGAEATRLDDDALEVYGKLQRLAGLVSAEGLSIVPILGEGGSWASPRQLEGVREGPQAAAARGFRALAAAYAAGDAAAFASEARALGEALRAVNPDAYPSPGSLRRELFYEDFNAFGKAWKLYLAGFLVVLLLGFGARPWGYWAGVGLIGAGFAAHSIGLATRWAIAGRAPVSDMYESLVFMGWGAIALGLASEAVQRKRFLALAAGAIGFLCLAFAENLPIDSAINPLVPVLAHTSWLAIHVMTVMLSYSAFALAMVLGHAMLAVQSFRGDQLVLLSSLSKLLYKTMQVGVLFLAAGIGFGAIWANESWGRYWGWDPKETWSLITFFVYLAIIHARFAGWLHHFGLAASAVMGFLAVVMTYYGVNFILATGLHAYGFSEGGQLWAAVFAVAEVAFVALAWLRCRTSGARVPGPGVGAVERA